MATSKPKIQGYVEPEIFARFEAFLKERGLSQSQVLEMAVSGFLELKQSGTTVTIDVAQCDSMPLVLSEEPTPLSQRSKAHSIPVGSMTSNRDVSIALQESRTSYQPIQQGEVNEGLDGLMKMNLQRGFVILGCRKWLHTIVREKG